MVAEHHLADQPAEERADAADDERREAPDRLPARRDEARDETGDEPEEEEREEPDAASLLKDVAADAARRERLAARRR